MLTLLDEGPTYLIIDAVDEYPDISGIPSLRERVLQFVKELVNLGLPKRIFVSPAAQRSTYEISLNP